MICLLSGMNGCAGSNAAPVRGSEYTDLQEYF